MRTFNFCFSNLNETITITCVGTDKKILISMLRQGASSTRFVGWSVSRLVCWLVCLSIFSLSDVRYVGQFVSQFVG